MHVWDTIQVVVWPLYTAGTMHTQQVPHNSTPATRLCYGTNCHGSKVPEAFMEAPVVRQRYSLAYGQCPLTVSPASIVLVDQYRHTAALHCQQLPTLPSSESLLHCVKFYLLASGHSFCCYYCGSHILVTVSYKVLAPKVRRTQAD